MKPVDKQKCSNCKFWAELKEWKDHKWERRNCCVAVTDCEDGFVIVVTANDRCEMWQERKGEVICT